MFAADTAYENTETIFSKEAFRTQESDVISLIAGKPPAPIKRRAPSASSETVDHLLRCWQILPSLTETLVKGPIKKLLQPVDYRRFCSARLAVIAFQKAQIVGCRPLLTAQVPAKISLGRRWIAQCFPSSSPLVPRPARMRPRGSLLPHELQCIKTNWDCQQQPTNWPN